MSNILLSIVLTGRNDNYGGDFKERLQRCISWTHQQLTANRISSEIVFVNYNPLPNPEIEGFINWPASNEFVLVRIVTVPATVHTALVSDGKRKNVPLLEYPAKNAGIRRAKGEYILCINPDIIIPSEIFGLLKSAQKDYYYRVNRFDFDKSSEQTDLNEIRKNITKIWLKGYSKDFSDSTSADLKLLKTRAERLWYYGSYTFKSLFNPLFRLIWGTEYHAKAEMKYHCNVSGDFMMMHRDNWYKLRAHNEQSFISLHVDSLMVIQAAASGLKEKVFPIPIYHKEHTRRYDATDENPQYRSAYLSFQEEAQKMLREKKPAIYNDENWGLNKFELEEKII